VKGATQILVATTNPGKIAELKAMLDIDVEVVGLTNLEGIGEIKERLRESDRPVDHC